MSNVNHACNCLALETPHRAPVRRRTILDVIILVLEAIDEAFEMRRVVHQKYPFDNE